MFKTITRRPAAAAAILTGALALAVPAPAGATLLGALTNTTTGTVSAVTGLVGTTVSSVVTLPNGTTCSDPGQETTAFSPWGDPNEYRLVPGGSFQTGSTSWTLSAGASLAPNTQASPLSGATGNGELVLTPGASALSPFSCVDTTQPTVRFMDAGDPNATLSVSAVFAESGGGTLSVPIGVVAADRSWQPSPSLYDDQVLAGLLSGGAVPMAVRFTAAGGTVAINDVFVDPRMRR